MKHLHNRSANLVVAKLAVSILSASGVLFVALILVPERVCAQRPGSGTGGAAPPPAMPQRGTTTGLPIDNPVDVSVNVREPSGMPLAGYATVKLHSQHGGFLTSTTQENSTAEFRGVLNGEYDIEVTASGYKTVNEHASVFSAGSTFTVYVYLHPEAEDPAANAGAHPPVMSPKLQGQIDKGLDKLLHRQFDASRAEFERAAKMAPANPDVQYLLGLVEYTQEHFEAARAKFQAALSIYPSHERSLLGIGELQLRTGDAQGAVETLEKAYRVNGADWRTHLLLGNAYLQLKDYEKALPHAKRAAELGKEHAAPAWMLAGAILEQENRPGEAKEAFERVMKSFPKDPEAPKARTQLANLEKEAKLVAGAVAPVALVGAPTEAAEHAGQGPAIAVAGGPEAPPAATVEPIEPPATPSGAWAPPDIDSKEYSAVQDVPCSESELIVRTERRMMRQLGNFDKFMATEHIEHQEVDGNGVPGRTREKDFNYLVFVHHPKPSDFYLEEMRDGGENLSEFPTSLATEGLFALALNVFGPMFQSDLNYKCEGLGTWRGQAAWRIRFEQKKDAPSRLRSWRNHRGTYHIPLKGRVWINASSYDVLHIETDLREAVREIQLTRDHLLIDYGPVRFEKGGTTLWLPWDAEMFLQWRGKRYHHTHTLRNYLLFSVDTNSAVAAPSDTLELRPR